MSKFKWDMWNFDGDGTAYIVAKRECPHREDVPDYIVRNDCISPSCKPKMVVQEGWCKWQTRTDWEGFEGERVGWYYVETWEILTKHCITGKRKPGWFPVWIVRLGEWY